MKYKVLGNVEETKGELAALKFVRLPGRPETSQMLEWFAMLAANQLNPRSLVSRHSITTNED
jgi:hypothetical protein